MTALLESSISNENGSDYIKAAIHDYCDFVIELSTLDTEIEVQQKSKLQSQVSTSIYFDFMGVVSSVLLLSDVHLETKIDFLFLWIDLQMNNLISFDEMYIAVCSFEKGLAHSLGLRAADEKYIKLVVKQWCSYFGIDRDDKKKSDDKLGRVQFFDFCTNRQHIVRRLLDKFSVSLVNVDRSGELNEFVQKPFGPTKGGGKGEGAASGASNKGGGSAGKGAADEPSGGDEWMANPAWKKTAELMTPREHTGTGLKPNISLQLDWVHGYRGFDCRNNVQFCDDSGDVVTFTAAAMGVVQSVGGRQQAYFGDHTDDIVCLAACRLSSGAYVVATGEMGKTPAIHMWGAGDRVSLACMRGYHTKAVSQLVFSLSGDRLFSIGVDNTLVCMQYGMCYSCNVLCLAM